MRYNDCVKKQKPQGQCRIFERDGQLLFSLNTEIAIPETSKVRFTDAELNKLDYSKLYSGECRRGRKTAVDAKTMFKILAYAYMNGIYSSRGIEEACRYRIDFLWLLDGKKGPDHSTISRYRQEHKEEIEELFYQYVNILEQEGETDHDVVFVDGTKVESRAGRYTFVWRGTAEKNLKKAETELLEKTGTETVTEAIAAVAAAVSGLNFVHGSGNRKSEEQRNAERLLELTERVQKYRKQLETMGPDRNSYSKTDPDATFMRMKEDHMRNGQLKPAYNLQFAVNSEYITGLEVFPDRTDVNTLIPFLKEMKEKHKSAYRKVSADAGYESYDNYMYLEKNGQMSFIKPTNFEAKKKKNYKNLIGRVENMTYLDEADCYVCAEGRLLQNVGVSVNNQGVYPRIITTYRCEDCACCPQRKKCCKAKDLLAPKELKVTKELTEKRKRSEENLQTDEGIRIRVSRSIQVEGAFALMKEDYRFRRFLTFRRENIRTELFYFALGFDLRKRYNKALAKKEKTHFNYPNTA